jgi:hypothetical protein
MKKLATLLLGEKDMNFAKRLLMITGGVALAAVLGIMLTPKAVHAVVSTLVTVVNTADNPAVTRDADRASRVPYVSTQTFNCGPGVSECVPFFTAVPSGFRLVIENISGEFKLASGTTTPPNGDLSFNNGIFPVWGFTATVGPTNGSTIARFSQPVTAYADPADGQPLVRVDGNWASVPQNVTLTGYLLNCSITPCPAIQH